MVSLAFPLLLATCSKPVNRLSLGGAGGGVAGAVSVWKLFEAGYIHKYCTHRYTHAGAQVLHASLYTCGRTADLLSDLHPTLDLPNLSPKTLTGPDAPSLFSSLFDFFSLFINITACTRKKRARGEDEDPAARSSLRISTHCHIFGG